MADGFVALESDLGDHWRWLEERHDGVVVRVAQTRADAAAARVLIGDGWPVVDAQQLFERVVAPSRTTKLRELVALCLVVDAPSPAAGGEADRGRDGGGIETVATASFVFDHHARTIEFGRGAIAPGFRRRDIVEGMLASARRVFAALPTYTAVTESTTLSRGAAQSVAALGIPVVALHPSNAAVSADRVDDWHDQLAVGRDPKLAEVLVRRSAATGLGRFMTCHHVRRPAGLAPFRPALTSSQWPFYAYTCRAMDINPDAAKTPQRSCTRSMSIRDRRHTATRTVSDPPRALNVRTCVTAAAREGFETLVVQVPCDHQHVDVSVRLERAGAILGGVIVDARGCWRASYSVPTTADHAAVVRGDIARLADSDAFSGPTQTLLELVRDGFLAPLERAC